MEANDILKLIDLTQAEITAATDKEGLYMNTTTGKLEYNGVEIGSGGASEPLPVVVLKSNDDSEVFTRSSPLMVPWNQEKYKDTGFSHDNSTNNTRAIVDDASTYQFGGRIRVRNTTDQRAQPTVKIFVNGTEQDWNLASGYIRNAGNSSDDWTLEFTYEPEKLNANDYVELELSHEDANPTTVDSTFIGSESSFWGIKLQGATGATGATGAGSNIIVKKNGVTVGTVSDIINFITSLSVTDAGSNETEVTIGDMLKSVYDPTGVNADAFDYANAIGITQITDSIITPSTLNSDQDDYNPTGFATCNLIRQQINGDRVITGFVAPPAGVNRIFAITNISTSDNIKFSNNDSSSSAPNRLLLRDNGPDKSLKENETGIFWYDHTSLRYRVYNRIG